MQDNIESEIFIKLNLEGIHRWENCTIKEVDYLKHNHRHIFEIKCYLTVNHDDRDVEFIQFKHIVEAYLKKMYFDYRYNCYYFESMSCEMIARELIEEFNLIKCEVNEDGENGSILRKIL